MFCKVCGKEIADDASFCTHCGAATDNKIKYGRNQDSKKCPNCGGNLNSFDTKCRYCGFEVTVDTPESVKDFEKRIYELMRMPSPKKKFSIGAQTFITDKTNSVVQLIRNFAIPNNQTDIMDFMILAVSNIDPSVYNFFKGSVADRDNSKAINEAWIAKYEQAMQKALMILGSNENIERVEKLFNEKKSQIQKEKIKGVVYYIALIFSPFIFIGLMALIFSLI